MLPTDAPTIKDPTLSEEDKAPGKLPIELKGSVFTLTVLHLHGTDTKVIKSELSERLAQGSRFFENAPIVVNLEGIGKARTDLDFPELINLLRNKNLVPVGVQQGTPEQQQAAIKAGLAVLKGGTIQDIPAEARPRRPSESAADRKAQPRKTPIEGSNEVSVGFTAPAENLAAVSTKIVYQPVRSGQQIYAPGGDMILLAAVNAGAEVIADGNIHVYGPLRGRVLAGVKGDINARIFCRNMEAELVAIAGHYRVFEDSVPAAVYQKAVQISLDGERIKIDVLI